MIPSRRFLIMSVVLGLLSGVWTFAQSRQTQPVTPMVLSGPNVGFRVEATKGNTPVGRLVVRVNGQWVEPDWTSSGTTRQLTSR